MFFRRSLSYKLKSLYDSPSILRYKTIRPSIVIDFIFSYCDSKGLEIIKYKEDMWDTYKFTFKHCKKSDLTKLHYKLNQKYGDYVEEIKY